jgi:hypothetical protein
MPQIIVTAKTSDEGPDREVVFTERVSLSDFESGHFRAQLAERLGWAVADAHDAEQQSPERRHEEGDEVPAVARAAHQPDLEAANGVESRELSAVLG